MVTWKFGDWRVDALCEGEAARGGMRSYFS